jgi:PTS system nitrogen regulatory IIA component
LKIHSLLTPDMIIPELESQDAEGALREMVKFLKKKDKISKEKELFEKLVQREKLGSTAIGEGVAIPHCKIKGVINPRRRREIKWIVISMFEISTREQRIY